MLLVLVHRGVNIVHYFSAKKFFDELFLISSLKQVKGKGILNGLDAVKSERIRMLIVGGENMIMKSMYFKKIVIHVIHVQALGKVDTVWSNIGSL